MLKGSLITHYTFYRVCHVERCTHYPLYILVSVSCRRTHPLLIFHFTECVLVKSSPITHYTFFDNLAFCCILKSATKNTFCHVALMRCLVKFVVLQSHSQSTCVLNQCHIRINTHLVSHIETSCFSFYFFPHDLSHCCLCFHSTVLAHFCF